MSGDMTHGLIAHQVTFRSLGPQSRAISGLVLQLGHHTTDSGPRTVNTRDEGPSRQAALPPHRPALQAPSPGSRGAVQGREGMRL